MDIQDLPVVDIVHLHTLSTYVPRYWHFLALSHLTGARRMNIINETRREVLKTHID